MSNEFTLNWDWSAIVNRFPDPVGGFKVEFRLFEDTIWLAVIDFILFAEILAVRSIWLKFRPCRTWS